MTGGFNPFQTPRQFSLWSKAHKLDTYYQIFYRCWTQCIPTPNKSLTEYVLRWPAVSNFTLLGFGQFENCEIGWMG